MRHLEQGLARRKHSTNVSHVFLTKGKEVPAMPSACLQPDGAHGICPDEKQIVNYRNRKPQFRDGWTCGCYLKEADGGPQQGGAVSRSGI